MLLPGTLADSLGSLSILLLVVVNLSPVCVSGVIRGPVADPSFRGGFGDYGPVDFWWTTFIFVLFIGSLGPFPLNVETLYV